MNRYNILIADDEAPARKKLCTFLSKEEAAGELTEAGNGKEAIQLIQQNAPDLVLLDIQMPGITGFEVIEQIGADNMPPVVFVTAFDEFALQAFHVHAVDYLLKPFDRTRFQQAFYRAIEMIELKNNQLEKLDTLLKAFKQKQSYLERITVSQGNHFVLLPVEEILYFQADGKYIEVHLEKKKYLLRDTLTELESKLSPDKFVRIHRSCIVNLTAIRHLTPRSHGDYWVELTNEVRLTMSRRYRSNVFR